MWVHFKYDPTLGCQHWEPALSPEQPGTTEVPDHIVKRWNNVYDLFYETQVEVGEWKERGMRSATRQLPSSLEMLKLVEAESG